MADLEKVIKGLKTCFNACHGATVCLDCVYFHDYCGDCEAHLLQDALALLKAQQPRVMTLDEMNDKRGRGEAVYYEDRDATCKSQDVFVVHQVHQAARSGQTQEGAGREWAS